MKLKKKSEKKKSSFQDKGPAELTLTTRGQKQNISATPLSPHFLNRCPGEGETEENEQKYRFIHSEEDGDSNMKDRRRWRRKVASSSPEKLEKAFKIINSNHQPDLLSLRQLPSFPFVAPVPKNLRYLESSELYCPLVMLLQTFGRCIWTRASAWSCCPPCTASAPWCCRTNDKKGDFCALKSAGCGKRGQNPRKEILENELHAMNVNKSKSKSPLHYSSCSVFHSKNKRLISISS
ncbi:uncharacterized protein LOC122155943 [Centrocercus urophasianus]|uniref:uncharacterized protein LOC122155943 n=1 Tax=Centrocercus urophasianus TaxID=9002 RepID=UPI001C64A1DE|nr:uncharacterized protein LOC122155943 [Centrocercus urophasianus]